MIVICKQTYAMQFICYYAHEDAMICFWLCFTLVKLMLILHVECIFFWIYNSCKLLFFEVSSNAMIVQKFIKLSKFFNHSWDSVHSTNLTNFDFLWLSFICHSQRSEVSLTTLCWEYIIYQVKSWLPNINLGRTC